MDAIKFVHEKLTPTREVPIPDFRAGDNVVVNYKIIEGDKERIQSFRGDVIQVKGTGSTKTFTVRKISNGVGVERIFPFASPNIVDVQVTKRGRVRRARLFYLRDLVGKKARIKERKFQKNVSQVPQG
ncbi:50S ribosomal protein L19 [Haliscomenobacter sp.]|jgi:large subunit ribosomal protein L19|uniref:50S ribosomal protein L19 n=1 Tax=Haliscomenobacter sp. TaxID=2717303 RepID=UPI003364E4A4